MLNNEKADLLRRRRECNTAKRRNAIGSSSDETIQFQRPRQNSRDYFSRTPFGYWKCFFHGNHDNLLNSCMIIY